MSGTIPRVVPDWLLEHGRTNEHGVLVARCPDCDADVLGEYMRESRGRVCCAACKRDAQKRSGTR